MGKRTREERNWSQETHCSTHAKRLRAHKWADDGGGAEGWIFPRLPG